MKYKESLWVCAQNNDNDKQWERWTQTKWNVFDEYSDLGCDLLGYYAMLNL